MSRHATPTTSAQRQRLNLVVVAAGLIAAIVLALTFSGTLSVFTQAFLHGTNTVSTPSIRIAETDADGSTETCSTDAAGTATCTDPDLYGGQVLRPGQSSNPQTVTFANTGDSTPTAFEVSAGSCSTTPSTGADLCDQLLVTMTWRGRTLWDGGRTPTWLATHRTSLPDPPAAGERVPFTVQVSLPADATASTSGVTLSQPITFTFTA